MTEDEMVGWHHGLSGYGFGWTLGVGDGQGDELLVLQPGMLQSLVLQRVRQD